MRRPVYPDGVFLPVFNAVKPHVKGLSCSAFLQLLWNRYARVGGMC